MFINFRQFKIFRNYTGLVMYVYDALMPKSVKFSNETISHCREKRQRIFTETLYCMFCRTLYMQLLYRLHWKGLKAVRDVMTYSAHCWRFLAITSSSRGTRVPQTTHEDFSTHKSFGGWRSLEHLCVHVYRWCWFSLPKNRLRPILMKLGTMLEVDETFTTIWISRSSEVRVKVRRWPQYPFGTTFVNVFCCEFNNFNFLIIALRAAQSAGIHVTQKERFCI